MKNTQPLISIVMPVRNAELFLPACLDSILKQTHTNWELLTLDDHSTDNSFKILRSYQKKDKRIKVSTNKKQLGVSKSANKLIKQTKSKWIARMDADDIMLPKRLESQLKTLQQHSSVVVLGSQCTLIDKKGKTLGKKTFPTCPQQIFNMLFWACPVQQPSIMVNAHKLPSNFIWYSNQKTGEEINFLIRISKYGNIVNSKQTFLKYRLHSNNLSLNQNQKKVFYSLFKIRLQAIFSGQYKPSITSLLIGLTELIAVSLLPQSAIMPVFQFFRGMKKTIFSFSSAKLSSCPRVNTNVV